MKKYLYILFALCSSIIFAQSIQNNIKETHVKLQLKPSNNNPRNSEGDFIKLKDGKILFIYSHFTGGAGDNASAYLASRYSLDNGLTWSKKDEIVIPQEGKLNIMSVSLLRLDKDKIALFYLRKNSEFDCIPIMRISTDEAKTWSKPKECITDRKGYYVMNNDRAIKLKSGRLVLPVAQHSTPDNKFSRIGRILCYYSDDNGNKWKRGQEIINNKNIITQEPGVIELNENNVLLFCRTKQGVQYFSHSHDGCESWDEFQPSNIKSPLSPASIKKIPTTGDLLLVWNNNYEAVSDGGKRTPLNAAISKDNGKNWEKIKYIENNPNGWYCYTAIEFINNSVLLGYCAGDTRYTNGLATTNISRLSIDWIYKTTTSEPYIKLNKNGIIELACKDTTAAIYYTTNMEIPKINNKNLYIKPFTVDVTKTLQMFAIRKEHTKSKLISTFIGEDVYQSALDNISISKGLKYKYFEGEYKNTKDFKNANIADSGIIENFNIYKWENKNHFGLVFNGFIKVNKDDLFTFFLNSNDGSILFIDGNKIIVNDGLHGAYEKSAPISLRKGLHKIQVNYFQNGGSKLLSLKWMTKKTTKEVIPTSVLFH